MVLWVQNNHFILYFSIEHISFVMFYIPSGVKFQGNSDSGITINWYGIDWLKVVPLFLPNIWSSIWPNPIDSGLIRPQDPLPIPQYTVFMVSAKTLGCSSLWPFWEDYHIETIHTGSSCSYSKLAWAARAAAYYCQHPNSKMCGWVNK